MRLKRLELVGFKSFADRTELDIVPGVTAVVGPNGSGKSNIADAIRWVLGEQSAKSLRGAKMEDIIFSGSQGRKAVNFCEVALTLDNADQTLPVGYDEVTVARRVYRSGDSEYLINRQTCRLRDIAELFMDTGVGREAYSIIGQGRIEEILSTKSEDRRGVFEEAAGIIKFKTRRKEAEKKLADAALNVVRVQDILAEVTGQLAPLEVRARVAEAFKLVDEEASSLAVTVLTGEIDALLQRRLELQAKYSQCQAEWTVATEKEMHAERELAELRSQADILDGQLQAEQSQLVEATARLEQCEADRRVAFERLEHVLTQLDDVRMTCERLQAEAEEVERERAELTVRQRVASGRVDEVRQILHDELSKQDGGALVALKEQLTEARALMIEHMRELATDRNEVKNVEQQVEAGNRRTQKTSEELLEVERDLKLIEAETSACTHSILAATERANAAAVHGQEMKRLLADRELTVSRQGLDKQKAERDLLQMQSRLQALRDLEKDMEGYASGPRAAITAGREQRLKGVRGAVAELMSVATEYTTATEIALGGSLQHIVVDSEGDARAAIEWLKKRQLGRATFLPLTTIRGRRVPLNDLQMVKSATGFLGVAAELVSCDKQYAAIMDSLLGNVLIARTLQDANAIARVLQHRFRVVTLEGDVVSPGGSMTGGSIAKKGVGILGRAKEIEELESRTLAARTRFAAMQAEHQQDEQSLRAAEGELQELKRGQAREIELIAQEEARKEVLHASALRLRDRVQALSQERSGYAVEMQEARLYAEKLQNKVMLMQVATQEVQSQIAQWEARIQDEEQAVVGRSDHLTDLRVTLAEQEEAWRGLEEANLRLQARANSVAEEDQRKRVEQEQGLVRVSELRQALSEYEMAGLSARLERDHLQTQTEGLRDQRGVRARALEIGGSVCTELRSIRQEFEGQMHQTELALSKTEGELDSKVQLLADDHQLGLELARQRYTLAIPLPTARQRLVELRKQLEQFGEVSVGAIEEFARLHERFTFLQAQEADLSLAQEHLRELINEMDSEMSRRFCDAFALIREQFQVVYSSLFGGGRADVYLIDESDPLQSGIEIVAEPPGKRMQTLSLLSGGERALTALSLLFAVLCVKPVPFCVLDEVEAALDEANVARFAEYLREFSHSTQFIVITHRRGTMEAADVLYGVTMQESGVSKLVSVRVVEEDSESA